TLALSVLDAGAAHAYELHDSHFHLTNYVQEGTDIRDFLAIMGDKVGRVALFGIPLQQTWSHENSGDYAPTYYLQSDAPLYYYSFTDAFIASAWLSLPPADRARFDPMITGFNPADMYAADHIRRVLLTFPGVFSGIGEFSIHKEFVSSKIAGGPATLSDPALHRILDLAAEAGLVVILHNDINMPFPKPGQEPYVLEQMKKLFVAHPDATIIWAHCGVGRIVRPVEGEVDILDRALANPELGHVYLDISWDETAKYITSSPEAIAKVAALIKKYPERFLFGSDVVAPTSIEVPMAVYKAYEPLWQALTPEVRHAVLFGNYERLFDAARIKVRTWEKANVGKPRPASPPTPVSGYRTPD
ncbi:MAG TPA: amidohydrolase family protein, partial [Steroidobacteraceae bacterium]|nr:amidohydrolase family protein [Steroidobacteraceae bacterium]